MTILKPVVVTQWELCTGMVQQAEIPRSTGDISAVQRCLSAMPHIQLPW